MASSHERDQSIERLLRQSRHVVGGRQDAAPTDSCLDAETLAAWADGALSGAALEMAEQHAAGCARCQSLVGALARIDVSVPQAEPARAGRWWLTWLVPLTAASVAVAVWVAVPRRELNQVVPPLPQTEIERPAAPPAPEPALQANQLQAPASAKDAAAEKKETAFEADRADKLEPRGAIASAAPAAPVPAPPAAVAAAPPAAAARTLAETVGIEIVSPDPMIRWRIVGSSVQHSINGGATWESTPTGVTADLTAGAAPSASVCWLVGRGGVVLISTDGASWRRVPFPETTDLSAVRARDALGVSVSTVDGRAFSTTDAGTTWVPRPLQDF